MYILKTIVAGALAVAQLAAAQTTLAFTNVPSQVVAGQPASIQYSAQDLSQPATITLRKGASENLDTIAVITSGAVNGSYIWIPANSLENASDYALEITQGSQINYSSRFSLTGADASAVSSALAVTSSASVMASSLTASAVSSIRSVIASYNSSLENLTASIILPTSPPTNITLPVSVGTGTSIFRNTTMVSPTLSASSSRSVAASTTTSTQGGASTGASSTAPASASSTGAAASLVQVSTSVSALLVVAALFFYQ